MQCGPVSQFEDFCAGTTSSTSTTSTSSISDTSTTPTSTTSELPTTMPFVTPTSTAATSKRSAPRGSPQSTARPSPASITTAAQPVVDEGKATATSITPILIGVGTCILVVALLALYAVHR